MTMTFGFDFATVAICDGDFRNIVDIPSPAVKQILRNPGYLTALLTREEALNEGLEDFQPGTKGLE